MIIVRCDICNKEIKFSCLNAFNQRLIRRFLRYELLDIVGWELGKDDFCSEECRVKRM